jgi:hypothetical protein
MIENKPIIDSVKNWIEQAVIGLDLCPFAAKVFDTDQIRYAVSSSTRIDTLMLELHEEFNLLDNNPSIETTLVIIHQQLDDFDSYNQALDYVDDLLDKYGWTGVYQVASFHPQYQFADTDVNDRENWSNRSPYPILHLLRESSLEKAIQSFPESDAIPQANIAKMKALSEEMFAQIFVKKPTSPR